MNESRPDIGCYHFFPGYHADSFFRSFGGPSGAALGTEATVRFTPTVDTYHGLGYLEAVRDVFGTRALAP